MKLHRWSLTALCLLAGAAHADTNLLVNGGFETGDFSFWRTRLGDATTFVDYGPPGRASGDATEGSFLAFFGSTQASGGSFVSQTFQTVPGDRYVVGFDLANDNGNGAADNAFSVTVDGASLYAVAGLAGQDYSRVTFSFAAQGLSSDVTFGGYNDSGYLQLDAVTIAAVPEPSGYALLLVGAAVLPWARRRAARR